MNSWYSLSLGDGMISSARSAEIEEAFAQVFASNGRTPEPAVFVRSESEGRLHCEVIAYFSPAAREVAQALEAEPCGRPARVGLELLVGDPDSWGVLFPDQNQAWTSRG